MPKTMTASTEAEAKQADRWLVAKEAAASLQAAYHMVSHAMRGPAYHPAIDCTVVQLACGTALEHGVMLARVFVTETPEEVVQMMEAE